MCQPKNSAIFIDMKHCTNNYFTKARTSLVLLLSVFLLAACAAGPNYQRPEMDLPEHWTTQPNTITPATEKSANTAGERWWSLYADPVLDKLEDEALAHNVDAQVATARILEARAQLGITESDQYPKLTTNGAQTRTKRSINPGLFIPPVRTINFSRITLDASYELDLWGKFRRLSEASRADLFATQSNTDAVRLSLTAQVAQQYFALLSADAQESAIRRVLAGRQERLALDKKRHEIGVLSEYELHQSEADADSAQSQLISITKARDQQEASLALLLGRSPRNVMNGKLERGKPTLTNVWVPDGLPAELLLRRPDLQEAEQKLIAMNARIGAARAQFFPSISLTSYLGSESISLSNLFTGPAGIFQFAAGIGQPIFNAGRIKFGVKLAESRRDQALAQYKQAVASAFADVRNALFAQESARQTLTVESSRSRALSKAHKQAELRYNIGISSRLEFLDVERNYLQAELNRIDAERAQRTAVADLFKALAGGWQQPSVKPAQRPLPS
ncbi:MAG: outer membrane protein, multidrug efflux system [Candidatus Nitrotoga sp. SPKER]|nr:MAG: outer membrane protein, multidrug efflux system [Candidatus Nitrotoga sp. SPKER]